MHCAMIRSASSAASTCSDFSGPVTPDLGPQFDLLQLCHDDHIQLGPQKRPAVGVDLMAEKTYTGINSQGSFAKPFVNRICFIGAGYVGGPTAAVMALHNPWLHFDVVDRSEARIKQWKSRHLPIHEPGLDEIVRLVRDGAQRATLDSASQTGCFSVESKARAANLFFSTDVIGSVSEADMIFIAVNTPTKTTGHGAGRATNMAAFDACIDEIAPHVKSNVIVVEKSTVPCGSAGRISSKFHTRRPGMPFEVLSNPEFLSEGTAIKDLMKPDRVVIGSSRTEPGRMAAEALSRVYSWVPSERIVTSNTWSAELSKLVANAMLAQRISSINSISAICEETGADVKEISAAIGRDSRIGSQFLQAGLGFGGSCFRKDIASLVYLAESLGLDDVVDYWDSVNRLNTFQRRRLTHRVIRRLDHNLNNKKIAILGFAFKNNTADCRESLTCDIVKWLLDEQPAEIAIFDPLCRSADIIRELTSVAQNEDLVSSTVKIYSEPYGACTDADAVLIATNCDQFKISSAAHCQQPSNKDTLKHSRTSTSTDSLTITTTNPLTSITSTHTYTLRPLPPCTTSPCPECAPTPTDLATSNDSMTWSSSSKRIHWPRLIRAMRTPARIFDARHVLGREDVEDLQRAVPGLIVEWIGVQP